jgi:hypothetical protein
MAALFAATLSSMAQPPGQQIVQAARDRALADFTGNWVAQITEDWRWRMITPPKGDYTSLPLNAAGRAAAESWDLAQDVAKGEQCRPYGAGAIMRQPTRLKIAWASDEVLRVDTDAGQQTRLFRFGGAPPVGTERTWQGDSVAEWVGIAPPATLFGFNGPPAAGPPGGGATAAAPSASGRRDPRAMGSGADSTGQGNLRVVTTNLKAGYLRKNGVPYSEEAVVTEYFDRLSLFGSDYLQVVTIVTDPKYLTSPFVVSSHFKREPNDAKWNPTPCVTDPPVGTLQPFIFVP